MKSLNPIQSGIDDAVSIAGFRWKGGVWLRDDRESILLVHLQKSNFSRTFYIGLGIYAKGIDVPDIDTNLVKEANCHVRIRADSLGDTKAEWKPILNLDDKSLDERKRRSLTAELIRRVAIPWLELCGTRSGLRVALHEGRLERALIDKRVREDMPAVQ